MRIMGLDIGEKTIGVALSDPLGWTAQGLTTLQRRGNLEEDISRIQELVEEYQVDKVVVGYPRNMDGSSGPQAARAENFAVLLKEKVKIPVILWDERLSTVAAERTLLEADLSRRKRKKVIDRVAAALILQGYLYYEEKRKK
ncbi:Holliday junction resolvase RuvX [Calderihabitans maritimus]|uniref:Putative pre-16S rRNA nuclease n=1 Tax=Calderihabitans maritimus TaxID=1246530 RepID=A0A1Z5HT05_9FIRM|nr:Holliday junction resolvase RuvX [Calderihabitans maritimus]GAW92663.1 Holliday junction resolvase [Calderihabitans maritimus]